MVDLLSMVAEDSIWVETTLSVTTGEAVVDLTSLVAEDRFGLRLPCMSLQVCLSVLCGPEVEILNISLISILRPVQVNTDVNTTHDVKILVSAWY